MANSNRPGAVTSPWQGCYAAVVRKIVYLSLGSNLGDRAANLDAAIERLRQLGDVVAVSSYYETEPVELAAQPWFLNCAVALETELMPKQLLSRVLVLEQQMGRRRTQPKGPRIIDVDVLLFGRSVMDTAALVIPHPALHERRFVLEPLAEIAPEIRHPVFRRTIRELRDALPMRGQAVRRIGKSGNREIGKSNTD
ncbi:MAG: 2-amino-4-hydroxy-6-hydroxymethyldihydropteridine diphosphokinase [Terriglobales bacterium]